MISFNKQGYSKAAESVEVKARAGKLSIAFKTSENFQIGAANTKM